VRESLILTSWGEESEIIQNFSTNPFLHGYVDFSVWPTEPGKESSDYADRFGPTRKSLLEDILFYWKVVATQKELEALSREPSIASIFINKIIASNWIVSLEHLSAAMTDLESYLWILGNTFRTIFSNSSMQTFKSIGIFRQVLACGTIWRRRLWWYSEDVRWNVEVMREFSKQHQLTFFKDALEDFIALNDRMEECKSRLDSIMRTVVDGGSLLFSQTSTSQAESASRITFLAAAFLPFSFASSLFAMPDPYSPGAKHFWIYWTVSLVLVFAIITIFFLFRCTRQITYVPQTTVYGSRKEKTL
jgi:hypothetical protein